jgi:hypothetical protein
MGFGKTMFVSFWFRKGGKGDQIFVGTQGNTPSNNMAISWTAQQQLQVLFLKDGRGGNLDAAVPGSEGQWLHAIAGVDNGLIQIWVNGELLASKQTNLTDVVEYGRLYFPIRSGSDDVGSPLLQPRSDYR